MSDSQPQLYKSAKDSASAPTEGVIQPPASSDNSNLGAQPSASGAGAEHVGHTGTGDTDSKGVVSPVTGAGIDTLFGGKPSAEQLEAARNADPSIPETASSAPITGVTPNPDVPFAEQVKGNAKYFAGKLTGNDEEVQLGAAKCVYAASPEAKDENWPSDPSDLLHRVRGQI